LLCLIKDLLSVCSKPHQASERGRGLNPFCVGCGGGWGVGSNVKNSVAILKKILLVGVHYGETA